MRYYKLVITDADTGAVFVPDSSTGVLLRQPPGAGVASFVSHLPTAAGGLRYNPGCAQIEFNIPVGPYAIPQPGSFIRIWGVGVQAVGSASDLNQQNFALYGGMQLGIAGQSGLANPAQAGLLAQGQIFQGFGNWQGTEQTIDLICIAGDAEPVTGAIIFNWTPGQSLQDALTQSFSNSYPNYDLSFDIDPGLQTQGTVSHVAYPPDALASFNAWLQQLTQIQGQSLGFDLLQAVNAPAPSPLDTTNYLGVQITLQGTTLKVWDSATFAPKVWQLNFQDLIGQPTWLRVNQLTFKTVMRADIQLGDDILFPKNLIPPYGLLSPDSAFPGAPNRASTVFKGRFNVVEIHHYANYRQPDADSWNTTFVANLYDDQS